MSIFQKTPQIGGPSVFFKTKQVELSPTQRATQIDPFSSQGIGWVLLNSGIAVADRLLQRLLLSKDQRPVDISKSGAADA